MENRGANPFVYAEDEPTEAVRIERIVQRWSIIAAMIKTPVLSIRKRRGNPNWGKAMTAGIPAIVTEFEKQVRTLGLTNEKCEGSSELRLWCEDNKNRSYVPERLLKAWKIEPDPTL